MAKRFTDSEKWKKPWWRRLSLKSKLTWQYLVDNCDHAGIWSADYELASFQIGMPIDEAAMLSEFEGRVEKIDDDKLFIPSFLEFQYGELRDNNTVHISVAKTLAKHGIECKLASGYSSRPSAIMARLSEKKKKALKAQDLYRCTYCGEPGDDKTLTIDHIVSRNLGGENDDRNLTTACVSCNCQKSDMDVFQFIERHAFQATLSDSLKLKLKDLKAPYKDLNSPKDKEEDKDKDKDKEKDKGESEGFLKKAALAVYDRYPKKKGKSDGIKRLVADFKKGFTPEQAHAALDRTIAELKTAGTPKEYIPYFSTWTSTWHDALDDDHGQSQDFSDKPATLDELDLGGVFNREVSNG
jgi:hypothetical protein